jgi:hypothetical protein
MHNPSKPENTALATPAIHFKGQPAEVPEQKATPAAIALCITSNRGMLLGHMHAT